MVIEISNKTSSSSSTCVLVRMVMEGEILLPGAGMGAIQSSSSFPFLVFQVLLFSFCLALVPAMYSSGTRGSLPAEHGGEGLEDSIMGELVGEAWPTSKVFFFSVLSRQLRALPHQLELSVLQLEEPKDSSDHELQAPGNSCCLPSHMPQAPGTEPPLKLPLPDPFSKFACLGPIIPLPANLTREGEWLPAHSPISVILQGRYSG